MSSLRPPRGATHEHRRIGRPGHGRQSRPRRRLRSRPAGPRRRQGLRGGPRRQLRQRPAAHPLELDITDRASIAQAAEAALDVSLLINNAGVDTHTPTLGDGTGLREELEVNYLGPVAVSRAFAPVLA